MLPQMTKIFYIWFLVNKMKLKIKNNKLLFDCIYSGADCWSLNRSFVSWNKEEEFLTQYAVNK